MQLTEKSGLILEAMAKGHTYEQILVQDLAWTYHDIFAAVREALDLLGSEPTTAEPANSGYDQRMEEIRRNYPRAYEPWLPEEDERLRHLFQAGHKPKQIAEILQRQPSAIQSRLRKLNLV